MTHTNVQIPTSSDTRDREAWARLTADLAFWRTEAERLAKELQNIPDAIERYGFVTLPIDKNETVKLVRSGDETERFRAALTVIADGEGDPAVIARQTLDGLDGE